MKRVFSFIVSIIFTFSSYAGTRIVKGTLDPIAEYKRIPVVTNWTKAVYEKKGTIDNFLDLEYRDPDWDAKSLAHFIQPINKEIGKYGVRLVMDKAKADCPLYFEIITHEIDDEGDIKGYIHLRREGWDGSICVIQFSSDEADDDDQIAFADQFDSIGESLGATIRKALKTLYKSKNTQKRNSEKINYHINQ